MLHVNRLKKRLVCHRVSFSNSACMVSFTLRDGFACAVAYLNCFPPPTAPLVFCSWWTVLRIGRHLPHPSPVVPTLPLPLLLPLRRRRP